MQTLYVHCILTTKTSQNYIIYYIMLYNVYTLESVSELLAYESP